MILFRRVVTVLLLLQATYSLPVCSNSVEILILDKKKAGVSGAVVSIHSSALPAPEPMHVVLGQEELRFIPQVLMVTPNSEVDFLNQDDITHHVYSFSRPWKEQFRLKQGENSKHTFTKSGAVVLGCNIHDWMLGYVYVLDTPIFGAADDQGQITFENVPDGAYTLKIQHPRMRDGRGIVEQNIVVGSENEALITITLRKSMLPPRDQVPDLDSYQ